MKIVLTRMILIYSIIFLGSYMSSSIEHNQDKDNKQPIIKRPFSAIKYNLRIDAQNIKRKLSTEEMCFEVNGSVLCSSIYCNETDGYDCTCELTIDSIECDSCTVCNKDTLTFGFDYPSIGAHLDYL